MSLIETKNLTRIFGSEDNQTIALQDVSLTINQGEFVSIIGASGSGKSTLLHLLGLLDTPSSGIYRFADHDTATLSDQTRARLRNERLGFVFQAFHLLARAPALDNVMLPLAYSHTPASQHRQRAINALTKVGLQHRLDHTPGQLSGGEKQRVAIARALVNEPDVIFADEPTGNLDTTTGQHVMDTIADLNDQGHTIIVITHEQRTAEYANRIIELRDGRLIDDRPAPQGRPIEFSK